MAPRCEIDSGGDLLDVLIQESILAFAFFEVLGRVDEQYVIGLLALLQHPNANRDARGVEQVRRQADHDLTDMRGLPNTA